MFTLFSQAVAPGSRGLQNGWERRGKAKEPLLRHEQQDELYKEPRAFYAGWLRKADQV